MKNQTEERHVEARMLTDVGTGVFFFTDQDPPKLFVEGITYEECLERGKEATAFKWTPEFVADYETVRNSGCSPYKEEKKSA